MEIFKKVTKKYEIWISRQVLREYAAVVSRKDFIENPLDSAQIISAITKWESLFEVVDETKDVTTHLKTLISKYDLKGKSLHDANIVASMMKLSIPMLFTYNVNDFKRYDEIRLLELKATEDTYSDVSKD